MAGNSDKITRFGDIYTDFIYNELCVGKTHSSWDWESDERYAEFMVKNGTLDPDILEAIRLTMRSQALWVTQISVWRGVWKNTVTNDRLNHLRKLVKMGIVVASWVGTGIGGKNFIGTNRVRDYHLNC